MNCAATEPRPSSAEARGLCCLVGYGNPERGDDGLGPLVASLVREKLGHDPTLRVMECLGLEVELLELLDQAGLLILVDATLEPLERGWRWQKVEPDLRAAPLVSHYLTPAYLLGLGSLMLGRCPETWLLAVTGDKFGWGREISAPARRRAGQAAMELINLLSGRSEHGNRG